LDRPGQALLGCAEGGVELIAVWFAEDKHIDFPDWRAAAAVRVGS